MLTRSQPVSTSTTLSDSYNMKPNLPNSKLGHGFWALRITRVNVWNARDINTLAKVRHIRQSTVYQKGSDRPKFGLQRECKTYLFRIGDS